jgi:hypothetical protein
MSGCTPFVSDDGSVRGIMCRRGFTPKPPPLPEPPPGPGLRPGFPLGQRVNHIVFGAGVVTRRANGTGLDDKAEISFEKHGKKEFCLMFAAKNLKPADAP